MKLAIFDFDGTLFPKDTLPFLLRQWRAQKLSKRRLIAAYNAMGWLYIRYKLGLFGRLSREMLRRKAMQRFILIFSGMTKKQLADFFKRSAHLIVPELRPAVLKEVAKAHKSGFHTVLLSGGFAKLMDYVGASLGMDTVIGTELHFQNSIVDTARPLDIVCGDDKAVRLRDVFKDADVDWEASCAYADSLSDLSLLKLVGHPVAVNPDDGLKKELQKTGWRILDLS